MAIHVVDSDITTTLVIQLMTDDGLILVDADSVPSLAVINSLGVEDYNFTDATDPAVAATDTGTYGVTWQHTDAGTYTLTWSYDVDGESYTRSESIVIFTVEDASAGDPLREELTTRIRRRVHDTTSELYSDDVYGDCINRGRQRINFDLSTSYALSDWPTTYEYLLELRGTIEMCYIRGAEGASSEVSDGPSSSVASVSVPNLSVAKSSITYAGPEYWLDLAERLEAEYNRALPGVEAVEEGVEGGSDGISQSYMYRTSMRTGAKTQYMFDRGVGATSSVATTTVGSEITISWAAIYDNAFSHYLVERGSTSLMADAETVATVTDNHTVSYADTPGVGVHYYRVVVVNSNDLRSESDVVAGAVV